MLDFQHVGDVEWSMFGLAGLLHGLGVEVTCRGHQDQGTRVLLAVKDEAGVSDLAAGHQEVEGRAQGILGQVVDLDKKTKECIVLYSFIHGKTLQSLKTECFSASLCTL